MRQDRARGSLVSKCHRCGASLWLAPAEKHAPLHGVLEDLALQLVWPTPEIAPLFPHIKPELHGPDWWWQKIVLAFDRLKGEEFELSPAIDGRGFDGNGLDLVRGARLRRSINSVEVSEMIEYARAFAIEHGVKLREFESKKSRRAA